MNIQDIKEIIKEVIKNKTYCKSVLIDGPWGCGKTTAVKDAIKDLTEEVVSKKKLVYQSLFGIKDVSELVACFSYAGKIIYSVTKSIASPFTKLIPIVGEQIKEGIDNSTALFSPRPSKKKDTIFIFDDLERADESLSYIALLGFFNQLIMRGCRIICISSLDDLSRLDSERKIGLDAFLEKAFDRILYINEDPEDIIIKLFEDNEKTKNCIRQCVDMFESNIRLAMKAHRLLSDVYENSKEFKYDLSKKYNDLQILKSTICSIKAIYFFEREKKEKNDNSKITNVYEDLLSIHQSKQLASRVSKNINNVIKQDELYYVPEEIADIKILARCLCMAEVHKDYSELIKNFSSNNEKEKINILDTSVFYLDDEGKRSAFLKFKKDTLEGTATINRQYIDRFAEFLKYTDFDLKDDGLIDCVISTVVDKYLNGDTSAYDRLQDYTNFPNETNNPKIMDEVFEEVSQKLHKTETESIELKMKDAFEKEDYTFLLDLLHDVEHYKKPEHIRKEIKRILINNNFYFPDLSKNIDYESWSYCHQVAKISKGDNDMSHKFINLLKEEVSKHKDSKSAIDRAKALVQYNFDAETFKEFVAYCD